MANNPMRILYYRVNDLKVGDHIIIGHDGVRLKVPIVVTAVDVISCMNHVHINNMCYDTSTEVGLYAPPIHAE